MSGIAKVVSIIVHWVIVPGILLAIFLLAIIIVSRTKEDSAKASANAGFWAGLVLFVIYVASQLDTIREPSFNFSSIPQLEIAPIGVGFVTGFVFLWGVKLVAPSPMVGLLSLLLSGASSSALYSYIFIESLRGAMLFLTLGTALGALLHVVFFPDSIRDVWE